MQRSPVTFKWGKKIAQDKEQSSSWLYIYFTEISKWKHLTVLNFAVKRQQLAVLIY